MQTTASLAALITSSKGARALDQETLEAIREAKSDDHGGVPVCRDFDEDCAGLNYLKCYLYDPAKGRCPFLSGQNESK